MKKLLLSLILMLIVVCGAMTAIVWQQYQEFTSNELNIPEQGVVFTVEPGSNVKKIARQLFSAKIIDNPDYLYWHARYTKQGGNLKVGEYQLLPGLTPDSLLALLASGKSLQYKITFVEGLTFKEWRKVIATDKVLKQETAGLTNSEIMAKLGQPERHPEGLFFPDTYLYQRGMSDLDVLRRAFRRMEKELAESWEKRDAKLPLKNAYEALIMASIVEKETGAAHERPDISGVFMRRLRKKMRLQTDPTVIYGMGDRYNGNIRRKDLREATPYNTYVIKALPPTPICMPGKDAIEAAVHPKAGKSLYFVAKGGGTHYFSETLDEHNAAVRKYILKK